MLKPFVKYYLSFLLIKNDNLRIFSSLLKNKPYLKKSIVELINEYCEKNNKEKIEEDEKLDDELSSINTKKENLINKENENEFTN